MQRGNPARAKRRKAGGSRNPVKRACDAWPWRRFLYRLDLKNPPPTNRARPEFPNPFRYTSLFLPLSEKKICGSLLKKSSKQFFQHNHPNTPWEFSKVFMLWIFKKALRFRYSAPLLSALLMGFSYIPFPPVALFFAWVPPLAFPFSPKKFETSAYRLLDLPKSCHSHRL